MKLTSLSLLLCGLASAKRPNVLFILTDDQDLHMKSIQHMSNVQTHLVDKGAVFTKHFCTVAICCPSRANLWTGLAAHNTNVTDVSPPYGGYPKIVQEGWNDNYLPLWLQEAGYNTYYTGKLWNGHSISTYNDPYVKGFNGSDFLLDPYTYRYYDAVMTHNGAKPVSYAGQYSTDVIAEKAIGFLDEALSHDEPWFVVAAPIAPHSDVVFDEKTGLSAFAAPQYAERHAHLFKDYKIPRDSSFNAKVEGGVSWIKDLPLLNDTVIAYNDEFQRSRLRALQAVDELVEKLVKKLDDAGALDNTYIFYTTDNGFHISQHRMKPGKECGYDTDIHIPLIVRGPGISEGSRRDVITSHTDLAPTLLTLAGVSKDLDGKPVPLTDTESLNFTSEHASIEFWGRGLPEGIYSYSDDQDFETSSLKYYYANNTYKGLRLIGDDYSLYYSVWCTNEVEFYNVKADPGQIHNLASSTSISSTYQLFGRSLSQVIARLDALTMVLKSCRGVQCTQPWKQLHPSGDVSNLKDALNAQFDSFYHNQPKVSFTSCELGYIKSAEGPQHHDVYRDNDDDGKAEEQKPFSYGNEWYLYT